MVHGKMQEMLSKFKRRCRPPRSPVDTLEQTLDWSTDSGLLITGDYLPMVHRFEDMFENSSAMMYFMKFLEHIDKPHLLKFWIHVEGFKSYTDAKELRTDATHIYNNYIAENSPFHLKLPVDMQTKVKTTLDSAAELINHLDCFDKAQHYVWDQLKQKHFVEFLDSSYYSMHKLEVYKIGSLQLLDILRDHQLLRLFADFIENEGRLNLLEFITAVENFNQATLLDKLNSSSVVESALLIYNRFFQIEAQDSLNFDSAIRNEIEESICSKNGQPSVNTFERARQAANAILETRYIPMFVKSKHFTDYVQSLSCSLETQFKKTSKIPTSQTRESISSLKSQSQSEDAIELSNEKHSVSSVVDEDRISQCSSAYSCEVGRKTGLLARIDLLGRYESLFDNSLCSNSESSRGFKSIISRYVRQPTVQEDAHSHEEAMRIVEHIKQMVIQSRSGQPDLSSTTDL